MDNGRGMSDGYLQRVNSYLFRSARIIRLCLRLARFGNMPRPRAVTRKDMDTVYPLNILAPRFCRLKGP